MVDWILGCDSEAVLINNILIMLPLIMSALETPVQGFPMFGTCVFQ